MSPSVRATLRPFLKVKELSDFCYKGTIWIRWLRPFIWWRKNFFFAVWRPSRPNFRFSQKIWIPQGQLRERRYPQIIARSNPLGCRRPPGCPPWALNIRAPRIPKMELVSLEGHNYFNFWLFSKMSGCSGKLLNRAFIWYLPSENTKKLLFYQPNVLKGHKNDDLDRI